MENNNEKKLYTLLVYSENIAGILNQITAVFTRRQVNIESLNVSASSIKNIHKYTITVWSDEEQIEKINKAIEKKIDVVKSDYYSDDQIFIHEVALFKISTPVLLENPEVSRTIRKHDARMMEVNPTYSTVLLAGLTEDIADLFSIPEAAESLLREVLTNPSLIISSRIQKIRFLSYFDALCSPGFKLAEQGAFSV